MNPEKRQLIGDLFEADAQTTGRAATLQAGGQILRRRRRWRRVRHGLALCTVLFVATLGVLRFVVLKPVTSTTSSPPAPPAASEFQVRAITDDELLALFPDTPVGLATLSNGKKRLIFPRAGDEEKLITRL